MKGTRFIIRIWAFVLAAGLAPFFTGCTSVPVTGRSQLNFIPNDQISQLALTEFDKMKQQMPISHDPKANVMVQEVARRIAAVADLPGAQWEFVVFESKEANAFCLPGGKIGVYTGILPITKDDSGLATVLGHEVAHAVARHGAEQMSRALLIQTGGQVLGASLSSASPLMQQAMQLTYGLGSQLGVELPHSRKQESEADHIGLIYMARAGYNPEEALAFWKRFAAVADRQGGPPWFLRTHPLTPDRIAALEKEMPIAMAEFQKVRPPTTTAIPRK